MCNFTSLRGSNLAAAAAQVLFSIFFTFPLCVCVLIALLKAVPPGLGLLIGVKLFNVSETIRTGLVAPMAPLGYLK